MSDSNGSHSMGEVKSVIISSQVGEQSGSIKHYRMINVWKSVSLCSKTLKYTVTKQMVIADVLTLIFNITKTANVQALCWTTCLELLHLLLHYHCFCFVHRRRVIPNLIVLSGKLLTGKHMINYKLLQRLISDLLYPFRVTQSLSTFAAG